MQGKELSKYQRQRILSLRERGETNRMIAYELGVSVACVSEFTRKNGLGQNRFRKNVKSISIPYRQFTEYVSKVSDIESWFYHNAAKKIPVAIEKIPKPGPGLPDRYAVWVIGQKVGTNGIIKNTNKIRGEIIKEAHGFRKEARI